MIVNLGNDKTINILKRYLSKYGNDLFVFIDDKTQFKKISDKVLKQVKQNKKSNIVIFTGIDYLNNIGEKKPKVIEKVEKLTKALGNKNINISFLRYGEVLEDKNNDLNKIIKMVRLGKKVSFYDNDQNYYFISKKDLKRAIYYLLNNKTKGLIFDLSLNKTKIEDLIKKIEEFKQFKKEPLFKETVNNEKIVDYKSLRTIGFKPNNTIKEHIKKQIHKPVKKLPVKKTKKLVNIKNKVKFFPKVIKPAILSLLLLFVLLTVDFAFDNYFLYKNIKANNINKSLYYANKLRNKTLPTKYGKNYTNVYNTIYYSLNSYDFVIAGLNSNYISTDSVYDTKKTTAKALSFANKIDKDLFLTEKEKQIYGEYEQFINKLNKNIEYIDLIKLVLLKNNNKNILVLIQNSNELRTTGGFVGSYAILNIEKGQIKNYKFDDIYNIDGFLEKEQPEILVQMPSEYSEFLSPNYLYARDLNILFNEDLRNKKYIEYFEYALNTKIDGIVYLNLDTIKRILSITGPIYLGTFNTEVTKENVDVLAQTFSEKNYYEGSSQKKNFLSVLGARSINEFTKDKYLNPNAVIEIIDSISKKEAGVYFKDQNINNIVNNLNLSHSIKNNSEGDYLYIVENNLGENKVNKLAQKSVEYNVYYDIRRGIKSTDIISKITNNATNYNFPYGDYKGTISFFVPSKAKLTRARIITKEDNGRLKEVELTRNINVTKINNTNKIEVPFVVKPTKIVSIAISIEEEHKNFEKEDYNLFVQKQPGAKDFPLTINFKIPDYKDLSAKYIIEKNTQISL